MPGRIFSAETLETNGTNSKVWVLPLTAVSCCLLAIVLAGCFQASPGQGKGQED